jgi:hypothetical protein
VDKATVVKWTVGIVVRGVAWILAAKFGVDAVQSQDLAAQIGQALVALVLVGIAVYSSIKGRNTLLETAPPAIGE